MFFCMAIITKTNIVFSYKGLINRKIAITSDFQHFFYKCLVINTYY